MRFNVEGIILMLGGVYGLLLVYGKVQASKNPEKNEQWIRRFGKMMKILCPLVILFGLLELFGILR